MDKIWLYIRKFREIWRKSKIGFGFYFGPLLVIIYVIYNWDSYKSFQDVLESISMFTAVAAFVTALLIGVIDILMLLSDWYAEKLEKDRKKRQYIADEVPRQRLLTELLNAEQRGLSPEEILNELKISKVALLDFQTFKPFDLVIQDSSGAERDIKNIIWLTITLRPNNTYSLSAISEGIDINDFPELTNNLMMITEDEYERIKDICEKL